MIKKMIGLAIVFLITVSSFIRADEGMWIPLLLKKYNIKDMQAKGFKLTAEDIYSINKASMKDAVIIFGRGCTGELISNQGLLITNHHCGFSAIQSHSSLENDYLTNGFWAMSKKEELTNAGLTAKFLERMEDVSEQVLSNVNDNMSESERQAAIQKQAQLIELKSAESGKYETVVKPLFYGNQYFLYVYKVYKDVRLVGTPPSGIGKFGGDTDNWMWPRHTGDFSIFRIYADKNNEPAEYSPDNVPYHPKVHFPISLKGVKKGDFTMVFGYPGTTQEYLPSYAVKMILKDVNPNKIKIRTAKLDIMNKYMNANQAVRIQYADKQSGVSNGWKKWIGESRGLKRLHAIEKKEKFEKEITEWINDNSERKAKYGKLLEDYKAVYKELSPNRYAFEYFVETIYYTECIRMANGYSKLLDFTEETKAEKVEDYVSRLKRGLDGYFKDYYLPLDKEVFAKMIEFYYQNMDKAYFTDELKLIDSKYKGNIAKFTEDIYKKTIFTDKAKLSVFLESYKVSANKKLAKDPLLRLSTNLFNMFYSQIIPAMQKAEQKLVGLDRNWMKAIMLFEKDKVLYPDANFTLRVTYGKVDDYFPYDGVKYVHYTTLDGVMEKENPAIYDYTVPKKLKELYETKDYGEYGENGEMRVCFTASNHTTGGNSGSPVLNADGQLIGVNFDRNWEGTMSDIMYDPDQCRNISIDIRYALFIIDKFAGAKHLIDEMTLVR
jgi:hypothetical protein